MTKKFRKKDDPEYWDENYDDRELARIGLIALIDEATGYQKDRGQNDLQEMIESTKRDKAKDS